MREKAKETEGTRESKRRQKYDVVPNYIVAELLMPPRLTWVIYKV